MIIAEIDNYYNNKANNIFPNNYYLKCHNNQMQVSDQNVNKT